MEDKDKALKQLDDIHSSIVDSEDKTPLNPNAILLWSFASAIMFLGFEYVLSFNLYYAISFVVGISLISYMIEFFLIRRENYKYDVMNITHNQVMIQWNYNIAIVFAIILTFIFNTNDFGIYSYPSWVFLIAFANFNTGLILNKNSFKLAGIFGLVIGGVMFISLPYIELYYLSFIQIVSIVSCSGSLAYISIDLKRANQK